ncbi:MAG: hypothetical protein PHU71_05220 [Candidatus Gracilibacteria bacterium]|nr:hypothetical protein [Candidatus Gracilibacteria bacterium]
MSLEELKKDLPYVRSRRNAFVNQRDDEEVLLIIRKHWIVDLIVLSKFLFFAGIPFALIMWLESRLVIFEAATGQVFILIFAMYMLFMLLYAYVNWMKENLDLIIFTNQRVVDINQNTLFNRENAETDLSEIQDARAQVTGILGSLLQYGKLTIQTAAEQSFFYMKYVEHPEKTVSWLLTIREWVIEQERKRTVHQKPKPNL